MLNLNITTPESQGIRSVHIAHMIQRLEALQIPMHSILIARNDRLIYEGYYKPYDALRQHRMFSVSKTFTALAIGHLVTLGRIHLDDHIVDYFPEKCPPNVHPWIQAMTIRNMLEMRTCHSATTYKHDLNKDWVASFFHIAPDHPAGTVFHYDTSSPHVLCALVEKLTGKPMLTYIREDVLPELKLSEEGFMLTDPFGVSMGGSGLLCTSMDLMKIGYFLLHEGNINGRQVIAKKYLQEACSALNPTIVKAPVPGEAFGYGFQIWQHARCGYEAYGMGGQYILVVPEKNLILVTTADTQGYDGGNAQIHSAFFEEVLDKICDEPLEEHQDDFETLQELTENLSIATVNGSLDSPYAEKINSTAYSLYENQYGFTQAALSISADHGTLYLTGDDRAWSIHFGFGRMADGTLPVCDQYYVASGAWLNEQTLYIKCHICDTSVGSVRIQLHFEDNQLTIYQRIIEETLSKEFPPGHLIGYCE